MTAALVDLLARCLGRHRRPLRHDIKARRNLQQRVEDKRPRFRDGLFHRLHAGKVVAEAQMFALGIDVGVDNPLGAALAEMPIAEIIQHCRPAKLKNDSATFIALYAWWLARWTFSAMTGSWVRDFALDLTLEEQFKR